MRHVSVETEDEGLQHRPNHDLRTFLLDNRRPRVVPCRSVPTHPPYPLAGRSQGPHRALAAVAATDFFGATSGHQYLDPWSSATRPLAARPTSIGHGARGGAGSASRRACPAGVEAYPRRMRRRDLLTRATDTGGRAHSDALIDRSRGRRGRPPGDGAVARRHVMRPQHEGALPASYWSRPSGQRAGPLYPARVDGPRGWRVPINTPAAASGPSSG